MRVDQLIELLQVISDAGGGEDEITDDYPIEWGSEAGCALITVEHHPGESLVALEFDQ